MQNLLKSREFWVMLITLIVNVVVAVVPQLAESKEIIITSLTALALVIIGLIGGEKLAAAYTAGTTKVERLEKK